MEERIIEVLKKYTFDDKVWDNFTPEMNLKDDLKINSARIVDIVLDMEEQFVRTALIYGEESITKLNKARVAVFGVGGVGGYVVEALARSGVGTLDIIDNDKVAISNINRQIIATHSTVGRYKVDVAKERLLDINPNITVNAYKTFFLPENADEFDFTAYDYVVDAIDTVSGKLELVSKANVSNTPIISSMGAGNKVDPTAFVV